MTNLCKTAWRPDIPSMHASSFILSFTHTQCMHTHSHTPSSLWLSSIFNSSLTSASLLLIDCFPPTLLLFNTSQLILFKMKRCKQGRNVSWIYHHVTVSFDNWQTQLYIYMPSHIDVFQTISQHQDQIPGCFWMTKIKKKERESSISIFSLSIFTFLVRCNIFPVKTQHITNQNGRKKAPWNILPRFYIPLITAQSWSFFGWTKIWSIFLKCNDESWLLIGKNKDWPIRQFLISVVILDSSHKTRKQRWSIYSMPCWACFTILCINTFR